MGEDDRVSREKSQLEWRDYVAIVIAMFETTLLPIVIAAILLIVVAILLVK